MNRGEGVASNRVLWIGLVLSYVLRRNDYRKDDEDRNVTLWQESVERHCYDPAYCLG